MGVVYKARHRILDRVVALKMIKEGLDEKTDAIKRFMREVKLGSRVKHPNIVKFIDAGIEDGTYYIVMEYCEGISLEEKIEEGRKLVKLAGSISGQLFDALEAIHAMDIVHRDIKPANIILMKGNTVKLIDFGLVKGLGVMDVSSVTAAHIGLGTIWYSAPEQFIEGYKVDKRADIYALGATFYHLVCGDVPVKGDNFPEFIANLKHGNIEHPCELNKRLTKGAGDWLMKALAREPDDRYQSVKEFRRAYRK
jgi:serine/threonine-protein kinase